VRVIIAGWLAGIVALGALVAGAPLAGAGRADHGVANMTATQILAQVKQAVAGAKSVHVYGSGTSGGSKIALNLKLVKGKGGEGHLAEGGLAFDIIRIGPTAYFKGDQKFWSHFTKSGLAQLFAGKWLSASATKGDLASFTPLTDITALTNQILASPGRIDKGATTKVNGKSAVELIQKSGGGILYIATSGPAYPLLIKPGRSSGSGEINFAEWNKPVVLTKPAKSISYR
jgi:hypothetical protein